MTSRCLRAPRGASRPHGTRYLLNLILGALGVVYGDIGTSPLYAMRVCFDDKWGLAPSPDNVLGVLSLIVWSLVIIVSIKYIVFVMRADNRGEGGILALTALSLPARIKARRKRWILTLGLIGAAFFYGDGMITPAISVLSAIEGLEVVTPVLHPFVIPITVAVLIGLFLLQQSGTARIGALFGPVMCIWFLTLALIGGHQIFEEPRVLWAIDPRYGFGLFLAHKGQAFLVLGSVFLAVTGGEALYADIGHFGKRPIRLAWFWFVLPALMLNYLGQGALLIRDPATLENLFYRLVPSSAVFPMLLLATLATVIASQAVISGMFSVTRQAVQLGFCPRLPIVHTSPKEAGQIYIPNVNWGLLIVTIGLVLGFESSDHLAGAYGIAVSGTMMVTTLLAFSTARSLWSWGWLKVGLAASLFLTVDLAFFAANAMKIPQGGWFPLIVGAVIWVLMSTWKRGRELLFARLRPGAIALDVFLASIAKDPPFRVPGTAIFLTGDLKNVPHSLLHNLKHNKVLHERVVLLTVSTEEIPRVSEDRRIEVQRFVGNFSRIIVHYGFIEDPNIPEALELCKPHGLEFNTMETTFFLSRETLIPSLKPGMALWRERLFTHMSRMATSAMEFFKIPTDRLVELGSQIEI